MRKTKLNGKSNFVTKLCAENHFYILQLRKHKREINTKKESLCIRIWIGISSVYTQSETKTFIQLRCAPCVSWTQRLSCQLSVTANFFASYSTYVQSLRVRGSGRSLNLLTFSWLKKIKFVFFGNSSECALKNSCWVQFSTAIDDEKGNSVFLQRKFSLSCWKSIKAQN